MIKADNLNQRLIDAHARGEKQALVNLYTQAADMAGDVDQECFFLTQAYIFALETGDEQRTI